MSSCGSVCSYTSRVLLVLLLVVVVKLILKVKIRLTSVLMLIGAVLLFVLVTSF